MGWLCACSALGGLVLAAGDAVVTQRENEGLQDGRHDAGMEMFLFILFLYFMGLCVCVCASEE